jgi:phage replication-related protein YjqB (UPF0714/DUF867 family)
VTVTRRAVLGMIAGAAAVPYGSVGELMARPIAASTTDVYPSNTALYADPTLAEGVDYGRRYRRHAVVDDDLAGGPAVPTSTIIAPHGGGIEPGTSELCLAVAGYDPASLAVTPAGGPTYDYWMFEGLRPSDNSALHVTATNCDDGVARSLCAGARNALALHGCTPAQAGLEDDAQAVLVGGRNTTFKRHLLEACRAAGFRALDAAGHESLAGSAPDNIANRTLLGMGGQLEITTPLRTAMFITNTRAQRKHTTTPVFSRFVEAVRAAVAAVEAGQPSS